MTTFLNWVARCKNLDAKSGASRILRQGFYNVPPSSARWSLLSSDPGRGLFLLRIFQEVDQLFDLVCPPAHVAEAPTLYLSAAGSTHDRTPKEPVQKSNPLSTAHYLLCTHPKGQRSE